jgi:hypothetical protein
MSLVGVISSPNQAVREHKYTGPVRYGGDQDESLDIALQGIQAKLILTNSMCFCKFIFTCERLFSHTDINAVKISLE